MKKLTFNKAINEAIDEEMTKDPSVLVFGEDVRAWGAPMGELAGLFKKYGPSRVYDTPISETAIIGVATGVAAMGMRPIAHIMFCEFLGVCMSEIMNCLCKMRYMTGGQVSFPVTILSMIGGGLSAAAEHSSCIDGLLMSIVGLKVVIPSTPYDAKGLVKSAIRENNPVIVLNHKLLLTSTLESEIPEEDYIIPLGEADIRRAGEDVTVVATSLMVHRALAAADELQKKGISIEVIDPRTLVPLDEKTIIDSVKKTGRLVIMDEEPKIGSVASEISALVAEEAFDSLKAPIRRVCPPHTPIPFAPNLEKIWMPDEKDLLKTVTEIV